MSAEPVIADPLSDYSVYPGSYMLESYAADHGFSGIEGLDSYYQGALAALSILGLNDQSSLDDITKLARQLIHECKYYLK